MRSFLAINFPEDFKERLSEELAFLSGEKLKRVKKENIHITLFFMGQALSLNDKERFLSLMEGLNFPSFDLSIGKAGCFKKGSFPEVLWLSLEKGENEVRSLHSSLRERLLSAGLCFSGDFIPHITVARAKGQVEPSVMERFLSLDFSGKFSFRVESFAWMESRLSSSGPEYFKLGVKRLK
ncbi:MAG: RNA 2',3'-cyclic phosphodiesterase [Elusimicrobiota bacterium]